MAKKKKANSEFYRWPQTVSGSTASHQTFNDSLQSNDVLDCMEKLSDDFNKNYSSKEKLFSIVTESKVHPTMGSLTNRTISFHVTSLETKKTRNVMIIDVLSESSFSVELSIFTEKGRESIDKAESCSQLEIIFLKALNNSHITEQLGQLRNKLLS